MRDVYVPEAGPMIAAFEAGRRGRQEREQNNALRNAGSLMTGGDYEGAAAAVMPYDMRAGLAIRGIGTEQAKTHRRAEYGSKIAAGQGDEAVTGAMGEGDFELAGELRAAIDAASEAQKKLVHERASRVAEIVAPLGEIPETDMAARKAFIQQHRADLLAAGYKDDQVDTFEPTNANLVPIYTQALGLANYLERTAPKVVGNALVRPGLTGGAKVEYEGDKYLTVPEGGTIVAVGGEGGAPGASAASGRAAAPAGGVYDQVAQLASGAGAQPGEVDYLRRLAQVESSGDASARNGSSTGLFQFHPDTFAEVGGRNIHDIGDQTKAALALSRRDREALQGLGVAPTDANLYIMHQQGPGGGRALLTAPPETNAVAALTPVYGNPERARQAIVGNGGSPDMSAGQFVDMWRQRWSGGQQAQSQGAAQPQPQAAPQGGGMRVVAQGRPKPRGHMATAQEKAALQIDANVPVWIDADGKPAPIAGEKPNKPLTEYQGKSVEYLNAALAGNERLNELARSGIYKPSTATDSLFARERDGTIRFVARSDEDRRYIQAAKEWLAPILRKDTGAAVTDGEVSQYMDIYIPRYEDSPTVMWQKAKARDAKMSALYGANRGSYDQTFGPPQRWQVLSDPRGVPKARQGKPGGPTGSPVTSGAGWKVIP